MDIAVTFKGRAWRSLIVSVALSALGYLAFSLWGGWREVVAAVARVGWWGTGLMLALSLVNYALRFFRWQLYLSAQGQRVYWKRSLVIYLAGFALTTTPGKAGEMVRSVFLKPLGMGYGQSMAAFISERLSDLLAIVLLACLGLIRYPPAWPLVVTGAGTVIALLVLLSQVRLLRLLEERARKRSGRMSAVYCKVLQMLVDARSCHEPKLLLLATLLSLVAWTAEAYAFHLMLAWLGLQVDITFAFFVYAAAMLAGALSFLPGGLGGAEATMVALLLWAGQPQATSVAATVLIRLTTLWFAVVLGLVALCGLLRTTPAAAAAGLRPADTVQTPR